jgi:nicotinamide-nucleotide amidase
MNKGLLNLATQIGQDLQRHQLMLVTAESCTGGQVAEVITSIAGSANWFERGFVTYANVAKQEMLGVSAATLENYGAVSEQTAQEMAEGALQHSHAQISLAITGIAGPGGGTVDKPVGFVCFAWAGKQLVTQTQQRLFAGDRLSVRTQAVYVALQGLMKFIV